MKSPLIWLRTHKFETHLIAFLLMVLPPAPMYWAARGGEINWILALLGLVILGNLLVLTVK